MRFTLRIRSFSFRPATSIAATASETATQEDENYLIKNVSEADSKLNIAKDY